MKTPPGNPLISARRLRARVRALAGEITAHYGNRPPMIVGLMNGSLFFLVDLLRELPAEYHVECWRVQSYQGKNSTGKLRGLDACQGNFQGRPVLIVDDILDTGKTLAAVREKALACGARSVHFCVLLHKHKTRAKKITARWVGFDIGDEFVVGYGLDLDGCYRSLPDIRVLRD